MVAKVSRDTRVLKRVLQTIARIGVGLWTLLILEGCVPMSNPWSSQEPERVPGLGNAICRQEYDTARNLIAKRLSQSSDDAEARLYAGYIEEKSGHPMKARPYYDVARRLSVVSRITLRCNGEVELDGFTRSLAQERLDKINKELAMLDVSAAQIERIEPVVEREEGVSVLKMEESLSAKPLESSRLKPLAPVAEKSSSARRENRTSKKSASVRASVNSHAKPVAPTSGPVVPNAKAVTQNPKAITTQGGYIIQIISLTHKGNSEMFVSSLKKNFPALKPYTIKTEDASTAQGALYRIYATGFSSQEVANRVCTELKAKGQNCLTRQR